MTEVDIREVGSRLSELLLRVAAGEEIVIARAGKPVARFVPVKEREPRVLGVDRGRLEVPEDFDAPLDEATLARFAR